MGIINYNVLRGFDVDGVRIMKYPTIDDSDVIYAYELKEEIALFLLSLIGVTMAHGSNRRRLSSHYVNEANVETFRQHLLALNEKKCLNVTHVPSVNILTMIPRTLLGFIVLVCGELHISQPVHKRPGK